LNFEVDLFLFNYSLDNCRIMSSARRPLWLRWTNGSEYAEHYFPTFDLIFKNGDGKIIESIEILIDSNSFQIFDKIC
jgi:hypothetical protein